MKEINEKMEKNPQPCHEPEPVQSSAEEVVELEETEKTEELFQVSCNKL